MTFVICPYLSEDGGAVCLPVPASTQLSWPFVSKVTSPSRRNPRRGPGGPDQDWCLRPLDSPTASHSVAGFTPTRPGGSHITFPALSRPQKSLGASPGRRANHSVLNSLSLWREQGDAGVGKAPQEAGALAEVGPVGRNRADTRGASRAPRTAQAPAHELRLGRASPARQRPSGTWQSAPCLGLARKRRDAGTGGTF